MKRPRCSPGSASRPKPVSFLNYTPREGASVPPRGHVLFADTHLHSRLTTYEAKPFNVKMPQGGGTQLQDRAYTSPVQHARKS